MLQDLAATREQTQDRPPNPGKGLFENNDTSTADYTAFGSYVSRLLTTSQQSTGEALSSPTETSPSRGDLDELVAPASMEELISLVIMHGNTAASTRNANRFDIHRAGIHVAVIQLARTAYRVGEQVNGMVDFEKSADTCYTMHVSLETTELVESTLALRSRASVHRATRKVYAVSTECTLNASRAPFSFTIPNDATPAFVTSGVQLEWRLRFEFVTGVSGRIMQGEDLLEEVLDDERGTTYAAFQELPSESFDVHIPIRVYGNKTAVTFQGADRLDYAI